jgi:methylisocitrate lyase
LHITARTDARAPLGLDEAIERAKMARDTGVDALFVEAPQSIVEMERIAAALPDITLVANMVETGLTPLLSVAELAELGFQLVVSPLSMLFSAVHAMQNSLRHLATEGTMRGRLDELVDFEGFGRVVGLSHHLAADVASGNPAT